MHRKKWQEWQKRSYQENDKATNMNKLIVDVKEPLKCLEAMPDKSYQMIYMEPPFNLGRKDWVFSNGSDPDENDRQYGEYISKLVENTERLLLDDGILCFSIISSMNNNYNYQMILEHFFKSILPITLNDRTEKLMCPSFSCQRGRCVNRQGNDQTEAEIYPRIL